MKFQLFDIIFLTVLRNHLIVAFLRIPRPLLTSTTTQLFEKRPLPSWAVRENNSDEEEDTDDDTIVLLNGDIVDRKMYFNQVEETGNHFMDGFLDAEEDDGSIAFLTIEDIADLYKFDIHYLGDLFCTMGIRAPIIDKVQLPIRDYLSTDQMITLLEALHSLDSAELADEYDNPSVINLTNSLGLDYAFVEGVCIEKRMPLPFGKDTVLHVSLFSELYQYLTDWQAMSEDERTDAEFGNWL